MDSGFIERLRLPISNTRLESYGTPDEDAEIKIHRYFWNIELSQAFYPLLHAFEVSLRNTIHRTLTAETGTEKWFEIEGFLGEEQLEKIAAVIESLNSQGKDVTPDRIVSRLMFGFWTSLLNRPFEERLWYTGHPILLVKAFPYLPKHRRNRKAVYGRAQLANTLRNRVFHFEPIWHRTNLIADYHNILEALGWISPEMVKMISFYDRFNAIHSQGFFHNSTEIRIYLGD